MESNNQQSQIVEQQSTIQLTTDDLTLKHANELLQMAQPQLVPYEQERVNRCLNTLALLLQAAEQQKELTNVLKKNLDPTEEQKKYKIETQTSYLVLQATTSRLLQMLSAYHFNRIQIISSMVQNGEQIDQTNLNSDEIEVLEGIQKAFNTYKSQFQIQGYANGYKLYDKVQITKDVDFFLQTDGTVLQLSAGEIYYGLVDDCWSLVSQGQAQWCNQKEIK
ncbi:GINS [Hexamita inflata]|uniref:GINS n=1 Tax=Hexamita inflata TaxID=28002 RepID=A0AA86RTQ6_9EUKA|nr:GINS [Hexamita inflata]CAI9972350.1 GINS [Hexamita inflata]